MKHGRPVVFQRQKPGLGRYRAKTSSFLLRRVARQGKSENKATTSGTPGEETPSLGGWSNGSLSTPIVPLESRRTEKRQEPVIREGGCPEVGTDARAHTLNPLRK